MANLDAFVPSGNWKLHGAMCQKLWAPLQKLLQVFPQVEAAKPGSRPGLQALSMVNVTISKSKKLLWICEEYSKLYLAIIGNSLLMKFEKNKSNLVENIKILEGLVVRELCVKLVEIRRELRDAVFSVDESDIAIGEQLRNLIKKDPDAPSSSSSGGGTTEAKLEAFKDVTTKLGISSRRTALVELQCLQRLLEKIRSDEDKLNEKVVACLMKLMQDHSERYCTEEDPDHSSCSVPQSDDDASQTKAESEIESGAATFDNQVSDVEEGRHSGRVLPAPPEDLKCPISSQLMFDPVIVASGQTFERASIQKWIDAGHSTCPKTREHLSHNILTPNFSVKRLIQGWCRQNGVPVPSNPPVSPDILPFERALSDTGTSVPSTEHDQVKVTAKEEVNNKYKRWMDALDLNESERWEERKEAVLEIRYHLKGDAKARVDMGNAGFMDPLVRFLQDAISKEDDNSQEVGALAIYNLAIDNNRNQELLINAGIIQILDTMMDSTGQLAVEAAIALYQNISCLNKAKPLLAKTRVTDFIVSSIRGKSPLSDLCLADALCVLYNLATHASNVPRLLDSGIIPNLRAMLADGKASYANKALLILAHIAQEPSGNDAIREAPGLLKVVVGYLESEKESEQDQSAACLLALCVKDERCVPMILQEGVIPSLVMLAGLGRGRAKEKANRLLQIFRSQRTSDEQGVIQLEDLKNDAMKQVERMEAQAEAMQLQDDQLKRNASASASATADSSSSRGKTGEENMAGAIKELSKSASRRLGKKVAALLNPKHFSRRSK